MEKKHGKVSIIVPVYYAEKYIRRCVDSILNQTYQNLEVILVDDGSQDTSLDICEAYAKEDNRVRVYHNENHGVSYTRNYGLEYAEGDYVVFVDADDWIEPDYVSTLLDDLIRKDTMVAMCNYQMEYDCSEPKILRRFSNSVIGIEEALHPKSVYFQCAVWGKLFRKELFGNFEKDNIRFREDIKIGEDRLFWSEVVLKAKKIAVQEKVMYHYYINDMGAVRSQNFETMYTDYVAKRKIAELLKVYRDISDINIAESVYTSAHALMLAKREADRMKRKEMQKWLFQNLKVFLKSTYFSVKSKIKVILMCCLQIRWIGK